MLELQTTKIPSYQKSAVALGFFDGVHLGHHAVLQAAVACAAQHNLLPCAFTFAADSIPVKQGIPMSYLYTDAQKKELLEGCGIQALYCPPFGVLHELDGEAFCRKILIELFHAKDVFCGGDFRFGAKAAWNFDNLCTFGRTMGFQVHRVEPIMSGTEKISSSMIRQALAEGRPAFAAQLLGKNYYIRGHVTHGAALGRTKAVPTINMPFASGQLVPKYGVYVSRTYTPQGAFDSITDIGVKPTVSDTQLPASETFLLDYTGDLYEALCRVELLHFLRSEQKFSDIEALYRQISLDQEQCRIWLRQQKSDRKSTK